MRLTEDSRNWLLDRFTERLNGGFLIFIDQGPIESVLAIVGFGTPAFSPAVDGRSEAYPLIPTQITTTGTAARAELQTADHVPFATLLVRTLDAPDVGSADVIVDRTDFQRGGKVTVARVLVRLSR